MKSILKILLVVILCDLSKCAIKLVVTDIKTNKAIRRLANTIDFDVTSQSDLNSVYNFNVGGQ